VSARARAGRTARARAVAAIAAVLAALAGCVSTIGRYDFLDQSYPERPIDAPIEAFVTGEPSRPYIRVARLDAHLEKTGFVTSSLAEALPELKRQARRAGCDAIVEISERRSEILETRVYHVTAIGVRYLDRP
jgi:hypothetical protein